MNRKEYIDLQVNGYVGVDFSSEALKEDDIKFVSDKLAETGTLAFCPTIITSSNDIYHQNIRKISKLINGGLSKHILGIHLEGPFISDEVGARGCHPVQHIRSVIIKDMQKWIDISEGNISLVTLAPELEGAAELIEFLVRQKITVCLGHHQASHHQIQKAVEAGAKASTHLGNGIPKTLDRTDNPIINQLVNDGLMGMFITDGHHLSDDFIKLALRSKGIDNFIVTSDSAPIAGLSSGNYEWAGSNVYLKDSGAIYLQESNLLAGSSATMSNCVEKLRHLLNLNDVEIQKIAYINPKKLLNNS